MKKGLELFGEQGDKAVTKELQNIHDMNTYKPMDASKLSCQEKKDYLASMLFITEKSNGDLKARKLEIGRKQRTYDSVLAWASGFERINSLLSMLGVTGSIPQFRKPKNFRKGRLQVFRPTCSSKFSRCWVMVS